MALPTSGPIAISDFNTILGRAANTANSALAGGDPPAPGSLLYIAAEQGVINQTAPFGFNDWYGFEPSAGIQYLGSLSSTGTTIDITDLSLQEGDMVMVLSGSDGTTQNLPTGYTNGQNGSSGVTYRWSYKFMGATPDTTVAGLSSTSVHIAMAFRNVDTTNPLNVASPTRATNTAGMPNPPSITTVSDGCMIVAMGFLDDDVVASSVTAPTGFTLALAAEYGSAGNGATIMGAYLLQTTAGTENAGAFGGSGDDAWVATKAALNPIGGAAPTTTTTTTLPPAIIFVNSSQSTATSITLPSGLQENDIVVICSMSDGTSQNLPSGYTNGQNGTVNSVNYRWSYKRMGATPDSTATGLSSSSIHIAIVFRNVNTSTILDVASPSAATATSGMPNSLSITTVTDGAMVVSIGFLDDDVVASSVTAPSGFTLARAAQYGSSGSGGTVMAAYRLKSPAGAEDPGAFGGSGTDSWVASTLAFRPV
jgi:hypothetical protein